MMIANGHTHSLTHTVSCITIWLVLLSLSLVIFYTIHTNQNRWHWTLSLTTKKAVKSACSMAMMVVNTCCRKSWGPLLTVSLYKRVRSEWMEQVWPCCNGQMALLSSVLCLCKTLSLAIGTSNVTHSLTPLLPNQCIHHVWPILYVCMHLSINQSMVEQTIQPENVMVSVHPLYSIQLLLTDWPNHSLNQSHFLSPPKTQPTWSHSTITAPALAFGVFTVSLPKRSYPVLSLRSAWPSNGTNRPARPWPMLGGKWPVMVTVGSTIKTSMNSPNGNTLPGLYRFMNGSLGNGLLGSIKEKWVNIVIVAEQYNLLTIPQMDRLFVCLSLDHCLTLSLFLYHTNINTYMTTSQTPILASI